MFTPGAETGSVLEEEEGDWDHGRGQKPEEAKGPSAGETGDHWFPVSTGFCWRKELGG